MEKEEEQSDKTILIFCGKDLRVRNLISKEEEEQSLFPLLPQHKYSLRRTVHSFMLPCKDGKKKRYFQSLAKALQPAN